jgi:hypothetical protein
MAGREPKPVRATFYLVSTTVRAFSTRSLMIYSLTLGTAFLLSGLLLLFLGGFALLRSDSATPWLRAFPRSYSWGLLLLTVATAWSMYLIYTIDLGEFAKWRDRILFIIPIGAILTGKYVDELLSARALGMVLLLAADPLLEAAFLRPEQSCYLLQVLAYAGIILGMFWIGMPYLLRDQLRWLTESSLRLRAAAGFAAGYGLLLLIFGLTLHRSA